MVAACFNPTIENAARVRIQVAEILVERLKRYIEANLGSPRLSVQQVCAEFGISRAHLIGCSTPLAAWRSMCRTGDWRECERICAIQAAGICRSQRLPAPRDFRARRISAAHFIVLSGSPRARCESTARWAHEILLLPELLPVSSTSPGSSSSEPFANGKHKDAAGRRRRSRKERAISCYWRA
jgi:hypothetical protein